jgi:hypothetical protein
MEQVIPACAIVIPKDRVDHLRVQGVQSVSLLVRLLVITQLVGDAADTPELEAQTIAGLRRLFRASNGDVRRLRCGEEIVLSVGPHRQVH